MNMQKLDAAIHSYIRKAKTSTVTYQQNMDERMDRMRYYRGFSEKKIMQMDIDSFTEYIGKLWSMLIWGNKKYVVDKIILDNGFDAVKKALCILLYGSADTVSRWDTFLKSVKGLGPATMSELLSYCNPDDYVIFNKNTIKCFTYLDIPDMPKYNYQYTGRKYVETCGYAKDIAKRMTDMGVKKVDLLTVDYFIWDELLPLSEEANATETIPDMVPSPDSVSREKAKSIHNELRDKIVEIGTLLGFESRSEVKVANGAIVDAVWEARIGNMGKAIYVFEVQSKGSIDSLILNLKRAQTNAAVQAVVAVSTLDQIEKIRLESAGVISEHSLRTWDSDDVMIVYNSLVRAHESINKLSLVPESLI